MWTNRRMYCRLDRTRYLRVVDLNEDEKKISLSMKALETENSAGDAEEE